MANNENCNADWSKASRNIRALSGMPLMVQLGTQPRYTLMYAASIDYEHIVIKIQQQHMITQTLYTTGVD